MKQDSIEMLAKEIRDRLLVNGSLLNHHTKAAKEEIESCIVEFLKWNRVEEHDITSPAVDIPLSKLEHFAGLAMQGILANPFFTAKLDTFTDVKDAIINELVAKVAIASAQALLRELQTQGEE